MLKEQVDMFTRPIQEYPVTTVASICAASMTAGFIVGKYGPDLININYDTITDINITQNLSSHY